MAEDTSLLGGGTAETTTPDPVVQAVAELDTYTKGLAPEARTEFDKLDPAGRVTAVRTAKETAAVNEYAGKLTPEQKIEFDKLDAAGKSAALNTAKQTTAYVEKLSEADKAAFDKLKPEEKTAKIAEAAKAAEVAGKPPEKYEFKLPDGFKMDEEGSKAADALFRKHGLTQTQAQEFMDKYTEVANKVSTESAKQLAAQRQQWTTEFKKDPAYEKILTQAKRGLTAVCDAPTAKFIQESWLGDYPGLIRAFAKMGEHLGEDTTVNGKGGEGNTTAGKSTAQIVYPGLP